MAYSPHTLNEGIFNEGLQARGAGTWAGMAFGLTYGALAGAFVGSVPLLFGSAVTASGIAGATALCAGLGAMTGGAAGAMNGSATGASIGGTHVMLSEIRSQFKEIRKDLGLPNKVEDHRAEQEATANTSGLVEWKTMGLSIMLGAAVGSLLYAAAYFLGDAGTATIPEGSLMPMGEKIFTKIGFEGPHMQLLGSALFGAASASTFGINVPLITSKFHTFASNCLSGKIFRSHNATTPAPEIKQEVTFEIAPEQELASKPKVSYEALIAAERTSTENQLAIR